MHVEDGPGLCYWLHLVQFLLYFLSDKTPVIILIKDGLPAVNMQMLHVYSMDNTKS